MIRGDRAGATRRAQRVRDGVSAINDVIDTLIEIQERQDWMALGYKSWSEYYEGEFGPDKLKLTDEERGRVIVVLTVAGVPKRQLAKMLGISEGTVRYQAKKALPAAPGVRKSYAPAEAESQVKATDPVPTDPEPLPADAYRCEKCRSFLAEPFVQKGERRCINCDADRTHVAAAPGGPCETCSRDSAGAGIVAPAGQGSTDAEPVEPHGSVPVVTGDGPTQDTPAAEVPHIERAHAGVPAAGGTTEERIEGIGCPLCDFAMAVSEVDPDASLTEMRYHLRAEHDLTGDAAMDQLARVRTISPAADYELHSPQQPGADSPTAGSEPSAPVVQLRSETSTPTDHPVATPSGVVHPAPQQGEAPGSAGPDSVEPGELEDGGATPPGAPSSSDPVVIRIAVEDMHASVEDVEVARAEWDAMTPAQRRRFIDDLGEQAVSDAGGYGASLLSGAPLSDLDDEPTSAPDRLRSLFRAFVQSLYTIDVEAVGPLLTDEDTVDVEAFFHDIGRWIDRLSAARTP